jgi:hypothetical protein
VAFLNGLEAIKLEDNCSQVALEAYNNTLKKHHNWLIQKGAKVLINLLSTKKDLAVKICNPNNSVEFDETQNNLKEAVKAMAKVLEVTEKYLIQRTLI